MKYVRKDRGHYKGEKSQTKPNYKAPNLRDGSSPTID